MLSTVHDIFLKRRKKYDERRPLQKTSLNSSEIFHHSFLHFTFFDVSLFGVIHKISTPIWQKWTVMFCHPFQPRVNRFSHTEIMHLWSNPGMVNILPKRRKSGYKQVWCLCTVSQCMKITWKVSFFIHASEASYNFVPKWKLFSNSWNRKFFTENRQMEGVSALLNQNVNKLWRFIIFFVSCDFDRFFFAKLEFWKFWWKISSNLRGLTKM